MITKKTFTTDGDLINWVNERNFSPVNIVSIIHDVTNGDWLLFYMV